MRRLLLAMALVALAAPFVAAEPTPAHRRLLWDAPLGAAPAGYWVYWALQAELAPRVYSDLRRVAVAPTATEVVVIDAKPDATGGLCFRLTATDAQGRESAFTDEECGFFGLLAPTNPRTSP